MLTHDMPNIVASIHGALVKRQPRIFWRINTMLCPIKVSSNTIELRVHTSCYCVLNFLLWLKMPSSPLPVAQFQGKQFQFQFYFHFNFC